MTDPDVRTRVWRDGVLEKEGFPLDEVSDYLAQPGCLVWADICAPDTAALDKLAEEVSLDRHVAAIVLIASMLYALFKSKDWL